MRLKPLRGAGGLSRCRARAVPGLWRSSAAPRARSAVSGGGVCGANAAVRVRPPHRQPELCFRVRRARHMARPVPPQAEVPQHAQLFGRAAKANTVLRHLSYFGLWFKTLLGLNKNFPCTVQGTRETESTLRSSPVPGSHVLQCSCSVLLPAAASQQHSREVPGAPAASRVLPAPWHGLGTQRLLQGLCPLVLALPFGVGKVHALFPWETDRTLCHFFLTCCSPDWWGSCVPAPSPLADGAGISVSREAGTAVPVF